MNFKDLATNVRLTGWNPNCWAELHAATSLSGLKELPSEKRLEALRSENFVQILDEAEVRPEDRPLVDGMIMRALNERLNRALEIQAERDAEQDRKNAEQMAAVSKTLGEFMRDTRAEFENVYDIQADLQGQIDSLSADVQTNREDIEFMQMFLFERMDPGEQLAALKGGFFDDMPAAEREKLEAKVAIIEKRQALVDAVTDFSNGAATLARIAGRAGVDPNVVKTMRQGAEFAGAAQTIATGLMAGGMGYLAAADAISGLVFGSGPDIGAQRHEQIMGALAEIQGSIVVIQEMLVEIQKGINAVLENQQRIYEAIQTVSQQIQNNHKEVMAQLMAIREDLVPMQEAINEILLTDIEACRTFAARLHDVGFDRQQAVRYDRLKEIFYGPAGPNGPIRGYGSQCLDGLMNKLRDPLTPETYELRRYDGIPGSKTEEFIKVTYRPIFEYLSSKALYRAPIAFARSFVMPVETLQALELKQSVLFGDAPLQYDTYLSTRSSERALQLLAEPLSSQLIERHIGFLTEAHPFFELAEALKEHTPERLISLESGSEEGFKLMETSLDMVEVAIAQQVMLSGDAALPELDRIWRDGAEPRQEGESDEDYTKRLRPWMELVEVLRANPLLRENLILYAVDKAVEENGNILIYGTGYGIDDDAYLRQLLPADRFDLNWRQPEEGEPPKPDVIHLTRSTGWHIKIGEQIYPLPSPREIAEGRLIHAPALQGLLDVKNKLIAEMQGYSLLRKLSVYSQTELRRAVWSTSNLGTDRQPL